MDIQASIKRSFWLLITIFGFYGLAQITQLPVFDWLRVIISIWLFLHLYWLGLCLIGSLGGYQSEASASTVIEKTPIIGGRYTSLPNDPIIPSHQTRSLEQTTLEEENSLWN